MRKIVSVFVIILFFMIPDRCFSGFVPYHFVDAYYDYNASLSSGYYNSDIFLTIDSMPNPSGYYYWSKTVWFTDGNLAYYGLQSTNTAIFSLWNATGCEAGAKASCVKFTGEGEGYSCRMQYDVQQGHKYKLRIWYVNDSWWAFFIKDMNTGTEDYLGKLKAPSSSLIKSFCLFSEYFMPVNSCEEVPYAKVTFSEPTANNGDYTAKFSSQLLNETCKNVKVVVSDNKLIAETGTTKVLPEKRATSLFERIEQLYPPYFSSASATNVNGTGQDALYWRSYNNQHRSYLGVYRDGLYYSFYGQDWQYFSTMYEANQIFCNNSCW